MKSLFIFVLGVTIGAFALYYYYEKQPRSPAEHTRNAAADLSASARDAAERAASKTREVAGDVSEALSQKMRDWNLTREDIKADLAARGEVARQNASRTTEKVADVRIVSVIKAKYVLERDLSAMAISVDSVDGNVTLTGTADSEQAIAKAVALAMDTEGVHRVSAKLKVATE